jgi:tetratricopeptide (TPR) repeat protein
LEGKLREALKELDGAIERGESSAEIYSARGHIQFELESYEDAAGSYMKLLDLAPRHVNATFNLAVCLEKLGRWGQAAEGFQRAWDLDHKRVEALVGWGICLLHLDKAESALEAFEKCLSRDPAQETALFGKAVASQLIGRLEEAGEVYRSILGRNANAEEPLVNLISIGIAQKNYDAIREYSERLLTVRPYSQAAIEGLATANTSWA